MILGEFNRKLKEASCHLQQREPFTWWSNAAKREIKELKNYSGRKLIKSGTPRRHWDYCLELESYIRSNTAHKIYKLDGEVLETIMSGETPDISQFHEFEWFEEVMFWDETPPYSDDHFKLERYLCLGIDIGPTLTEKIIKENSQILHWSIYQPLTQEEWE